MKKLWKRGMAVSVASLMIAGLVACSGSSPEPGAGGDASIRIQGVENLAGLDRYASNGVGQDSIAMLWGDMLISSDHKGNYTPGLVEEWTWADDNLSINLKLREGVTFSDGAAFTSEDVKATIERLKDPELPNAGAWAVVESVETPDDYTAVVKFSAPMPIFINLASRTPAIDATAYQANPEGYFDAPIGTGPYTVAKFDGPSGTVVLNQNKEWWGWTDDNRSNVTTIEYNFVSNDQSRISSILADEIDIAQKVPAGEVARLEQADRLVSTYEENSQVYIGLRSGDGHAFADPKLRQALSEAINRESIVTDLLGGGRVSTWPSPEGTIGFKESDGYKFDPEHAKDLVEESDYDGRTLNFYMPAGLFAQGSEVGQAIQAMAKEIGINLSVQTLEVATFQEYQAAGNYDLYMGSFTLVNADSYTSITSLIGKDRFATGFKNQELTDLSKQVAGAVDQDERAKITADAFQIVQNEFAPTVYLYEPVGITATGSKISGMVAFPDGIADFRFLQKQP